MSRFEFLQASLSLTVTLAARPLPAIKPDACYVQNDIQYYFCLGCTTDANDSRYFDASKLNLRVSLIKKFIFERNNKVRDLI